MFQLSVSPCHKVVLPTLIAYLMLSSGGVEGSNYFYQEPTPDDVVGVEGNNYLYQIPTPDDVVGVEGNNYFYQKPTPDDQISTPDDVVGVEGNNYQIPIHLMMSSG